MIYTLTLNPSLEKSIDVEEFVYDDVNMILDEKRKAEGKGIDVCRGRSKNWGDRALPWASWADTTGSKVEGRLAAEGILCDFTRVNGETRTNISIHQQRKKMQTLLSAAAAEVTEFDVAMLYNKIKQIPRGNYVVMTGSMPPGLSDSFYAQIITVLRDRGVRTLLDADGEALKKGVWAGPYLMKPNIHELGRLLESNLKEPEEVLEGAATYLDLVEFVVVSMGVRGAVGVSRTEKYFVSPPKVNVKSSIGAGDALMAGIVFGLNEGASFKDSLSLGVACGTASTLNAGQAACTKDDVPTILRQISMKDA